MLSSAGLMGCVLPACPAGPQPGGLGIPGLAPAHPLQAGMGWTWSKSWNTFRVWTVGLILQGCSGGTQGVDGMVTLGQVLSAISELDPLS